MRLTIAVIAVLAALALAGCGPADPQRKIWVPEPHALAHPTNCRTHTALLRDCM